MKIKNKQIVRAILHLMRKRLATGVWEKELNKGLKNVKFRPTDTIDVGVNVSFFIPKNIKKANYLRITDELDQKELKVK